MFANAPQQSGVPPQQSSRKTLEFETRWSSVTAVLRRPVELALLTGGVENAAYTSYTPGQFTKSLNPAVVIPSKGLNS